MPAIPPSDLNTFAPIEQAYFAAFTIHQIDGKRDGQLTILENSETGFMAKHFPMADKFPGFRVLFDNLPDGN